MNTLIALCVALSLEPALADAKAQRARVLVVVGVPTTPPSTPMTDRATRLASLLAPQPAASAASSWTARVLQVPMIADAAPLRILTTPAIVLIGADGKELGRVEGRDLGGDDDLFAAVAELVRQGDAVADLSARVVAAKNPSERTRLDVELAHQKLARGDEAALSDLERAITSDPDPSGGAAEEALFVMACYRDRVLHEAGVEHIWRELVTRFPHGKHAASAASGYLAALRAHARNDLAAEFEKAHAVSP